MRGRTWLFAGALVGIAVGAGRVPFLAGAAGSLADTALRLVADGGKRLVSAVAGSGAPRRLVLGLTAVIAVLLPGATSFLLVVAARSTLRVRAVAGLAVVALGAAAYAYQPHGVATGELVLALAVAALGVVLSGPLVAAPLVALAALIGTEFLPRLVTGRAGATAADVDLLHQALTGSPGTSAALRVALLAVAALPFVLAARRLLRP